MTSCGCADCVNIFDVTLFFSGSVLPFEKKDNKII